jgi:NAD(P)-dependent dehydrogenase (short-subunit alcohol dehydrogenase family)
VTGASSGIGAATSRVLAAAGFDVVLVGRDSGRLASVCASLAPGAHVVQLCDLLSADDQEALAIRATELDAVIHAAGEHAFSPLGRTAVQLRRLLAINVEAPVALTDRLLRLGALRSGGVIVLVSSVAADSGGRMTGAYATSKAAVVGYARSLAADLAPKGIRVVSVLPGVVDTPMGRRVLAAGGDQALAAQHPLGIGRPEDVASVIAFLCSPAARWMTGTSVVVDGGFSLR